MEFVDTVINLLNSTIRVSVPLLLACLAGLYSERSGVFDIGLEGKMLAGAFAGAAAAAVFQSAWIGLGIGMLISVMLSLVHGFASITHRGNQIVSGVAINFIAAGSTIILGQAWFNQGGRTPSLPPEARFGSIELPGADALRDVPVLGQLYSGLLSGHSLLAYVAFLAVPFTWWVLFRTRFGLRLRAVGENPAAVDTAGISVAWLRYRAVICTGVLTGVAGCYMALSQNAGFVKDMTAGTRLHRARRADLRQMEAGAGDVRLPAVRLPRRAVDPVAGHAAAAHRQGAGAADAGAALHSDRHPACRFHRQGHSAARRRRALCERTIVMAHDLFLAAQAAMAKAYAPYSKFPVGAAIRTTTARSTPAPISRWPPIPRDGAPKRRRSATTSWAAAARSPRSRWSPNAWPR